MARTSPKSAIELARTRGARLRLKNMNTFVLCGFPTARTNPKGAIELDRTPGARSRLRRMKKLVRCDFLKVRASPKSATELARTIGFVRAVRKLTSSVVLIFLRREQAMVCISDTPRADLRECHGPPRLRAARERQQQRLPALCGGGAQTSPRDEPGLFSRPEVDILETLERIDRRSYIVVATSVA